MTKLKMHSANKVEENIRTIGHLFPNCLTERKNENGMVEYAIDFDTLRQELSSIIVEGNEERYQFTWPDKRKSILLANAPIAKTLRPCREESVDFDSTENLYIEGDNLDVLKLLRETYLGKVKMIYIDPPYNTGKDFLYEDDFAQCADEYLEKSGHFDSEGNRMEKNLDTSGRFHTDWLNMIYPRLRLSKDLLSPDGIIFVSIDDREVDNLRKMCDEIFGKINFITQFVWEKTAHFGRQKLNFYSNCEYILCYCKNIKGNDKRIEVLVEKIKLSLEDAPLFNASNPLYDVTFPRNSVKFNLVDGEYSKSRNPKYQLLSKVVVKNGFNLNEFSIRMRSRWSPSTIIEEFEKGCIYWVKTENFAVRTIYDADKFSWEAPKQLIFTNKNNPMCAYDRFGTKVGTTDEGSTELDNLLGVTDFPYPKPTSLIRYLISLIWNRDKDEFADDFLVLDFFSGSATTAHAVMQLNAEDKGNRKFIMVQLPEAIEDKEKAFEDGYADISEIGKERIRRAGAKIKEESPLTTKNLDVGFRVLKLDSTNMKDVYYNPESYDLDMLDLLTDNIKEDRTPEDLLFQVMLDLGVLLSSKIEESEIAGKKVFDVADGFLIACFDHDVNEETIKEIAQKKPYYFVMRDSSMADDSVATNFDQLFAAYSPDTIRKVL